MFAHTKFKLPKVFQAMAFYKPEEIDPDKPWHDYITIPSELTTLKDSMFPEWVKARIVEIYKDFGVENPLEQKLVEPFAYYFDGTNNEGVPDFKHVDWQKVIDYFQFEAVSVAGTREDAIKLQNKAIEKYGHGFFHKDVYGGDLYS
jgi:hypothetical protein